MGARRPAPRQTAGCAAAGTRAALPRRLPASCAAAAAALLATALLALAAPAPSAAADRLVTFAARVCDDYPDISANRARNNIQESLRDLGRDTDYVAGEAIQPAKELVGQPTAAPCRTGASRSGPRTPRERREARGAR